MTRHSGTEHLEVFENQTKNVDFPTLDKHSNNHLLKVDTEEEEQFRILQEKSGGVGTKQIDIRNIEPKI